MELREQIEARIKELEGELQKYVAAANAQVAAYNGAIGELRRLIEPAKEPPKSEPTPEEPAA